MAEEDVYVDLVPEEVAALKLGKGLIAVVKMMRARTHCGLLEAKRSIERVGKEQELYENGVCPTCHGTGQTRRWKR